MLITKLGSSVIKHFICIIDNCGLNAFPPFVKVLEQEQGDPTLSKFKNNGLPWYIQINSDSYFIEAPFNSLLSDQKKLFDMTKANFQSFLTQKLNNTVSLKFREASEVEAERRSLEE